MTREQLFKQELAALCRKYNCYIEAKDHWTGYSECGQDVRMTVEFDGDYSVDPPIPYADLDLGTYFDGKEASNERGE